MNEIASDRLLSAALRQAGIDYAAVAPRLGVDRLRLMNALFRDVVAAENGRAVADSAYNALWDRKADGRDSGVVFVGLSQAARDVAFPLVGVVLAGAGLKGLMPGVQAIAALWQSVVVLDPEANRTEVLVLREIATDGYTANLFDRSFSGMTAAALVERLGLEPDAVERAVKSLWDRRILKPVVWGGEEGDFSASGTEWEIVL